MKIGIVCDHHGIDIKNVIKSKLEELQYEVDDLSADISESVDYPDEAFILGEKISKKEVNLGIAICRTGIGMSIALNKVKNVRCAKVNNSAEVTLAKQHNDINAIALASDLNPEIAFNIITKFITEPFSKEERHIKRISKMSVYEMRSKSEL